VKYSIKFATKIQSVLKMKPKRFLYVVQYVYWTTVPIHLQTDRYLQHPTANLGLISNASSMLHMLTETFLASSFQQIEFYLQILLNVLRFYHSFMGNNV